MTDKAPNAAQAAANAAAAANKRASDEIQAPMNAGPKKTYVCLERVDTGVRVYDIGEDIVLTEQQAKPMLALGSIVPSDQHSPAATKAKQEFAGRSKVDEDAIKAKQAALDHAAKTGEPVQPNNLPKGASLVAPYTITDSPLHTEHAKANAEQAKLEGKPAPDMPAVVRSGRVAKAAAPKAAVATKTAPKVTGKPPVGGKKSPK